MLSAICLTRADVSSISSFESHIFFTWLNISFSLATVHLLQFSSTKQATLESARVEFVSTPLLDSADMNCKMLASGEPPSRFDCFAEQVWNHLNIHSLQHPFQHPFMF